MQIHFIVLILGFLVIPTQSRPSSRLQEEHDSETGDAEYEGGDDAAPDDYLREDQSTIKDARQKSERHEIPLQEPQEQADLSDAEAPADEQSAQDKDGFEKISESNSSPQKEREHQEMSDLKKEYSRFREQIDKTGNMAADEFYSRPNNYRLKQPQNELSIKGISVSGDSEYGESLFKINPAEIEAGRRQNDYRKEVNERSDLGKHYYNNMQSKHSDRDSENGYEKTLNYDRDRRHVQNADSTTTPNEKQEVDLTDENTESTIITNIKKLSERDLEDLLHSLPEDKKALLKKLMDKREITKKASAVEGDSYLEGQADTSKIETYSVDCNTESSLSTDIETSKQPENKELLNTKAAGSESDSGTSGSKSEVIHSTVMKDDDPSISKESENSKDTNNNENVHTDNEELTNNGKKREINREELTNENESLEGYKSGDYQFDLKNSNDFSINHEELCSENEYETKPDEAKDSSANSQIYKGQISQEEPSALQDCIKSLEDSFPAADSYYDNNLEPEMAPLVRVKRTEKDHHAGKEDSQHFSNVQVQFSPKLEGEDCENREKSEFEDYGMFERTPNVIRNDKEDQLSIEKVSGNGGRQHISSLFDKKKFKLHPVELQKTKFDEMSLGSGSDSVGTGIEGVDDKLMYNNGLHENRTLESSNSCNKKSIRSSRTAGPMNVDAQSDNYINIPQNEENEAFGPVLRNPEEDISRFKRVRQTNQASLLK